MERNNFYPRMLSRFVYNFVLLLFCLIAAIAILAYICGDGNNGLIDILNQEN